MGISKGHDFDLQNEVKLTKPTQLLTEHGHKPLMTEETEDNFENVPNMLKCKKKVSCLFKLRFIVLQQSWKASQTFTICFKKARHPTLSSPQTLSTYWSDRSAHFVCC